jgi:hypothetical protein
LAFAKYRKGSVDMKRILLPLVARFLVRSVFLITVRSAVSQRLIASGMAVSTTVCGALSGDATWTAANSPQDICAQGASVPPGMTLTIEPGATVQFENAPTNKLTVVGSLVAVGSSSLPITITGVTTTAGSWGGINVDGSLANPAHLNLDYVTLDYGGVSGSYGAEIY